MIRVRGGQIRRERSPVKINLFKDILPTRSSMRRMSPRRSASSPLKMRIAKEAVRRNPVCMSLNQHERH